MTWAVRLAIGSCLAASSALAGVTAGSIELRLVTPMPDLQEGPLQVNNTGGPISVDLYLQARIVGDATAETIVTFAGLVQSSLVTGATIEPALLTGDEAFDLPFGTSPGADPFGRMGLFPTYRDDPSCGGGPCEPPPSPPHEIIVQPLNDTGGPGSDVLQWSNVFKLTWSTEDLTDRDVTLLASGGFGGYTNADGFQQPTVVHADEFTVIIGDGDTACVADITDDGIVDLRDLLEFLDAWLDELPDADVNDDGVTNMFDLGAYLDLYFDGC